MPLENLGKDEQLNIRRIENHEPHQEQLGIFELEQAKAREELWPEVQEFLEKNERNFPYPDFELRRSYFVDIFPKVQNFLLSRNDASLLRSYVNDRLRPKKSTSEFFREILKIKKITPDATFEELGVTEEDKKELFSDTSFDSRKKLQYIVIASMVNAISPVEARERIESLYDQFKIMAQRDLSKEPLQHSTFDALMVAQNLRLLFPDRFTSVDVDKMDWATIQKWLTELREDKQIVSYGELLSLVKAVRADKVWVEAGNIMSESDNKPVFENSVPPMPETKK